MVILKICLDSREGLLNWIVIREVIREKNKFADLLVVSK